MARGFVPIFYDWTKVTEELDDQEKGRLIDAVVLFASGGDWQERIKGNERYLFPAFKEQINRSVELSDIRSAARKNKTEQNLQNVSKQNKIANKEKEEEEEKNEEEKKENGKARSRAPFAPPTVEMVAEYCRERGNKVDPENFVAFYASKGWKVGSQPMKDWKAAVVTWEKRDGKAGTQAPGKPKTVLAQQYSQRDYSEPGMSLDEALRMMGGGES